LFNLPLTEQNTLYDQIGTVGNTSPANPLPAYLPKSGLAPNGVQMAAGITFPINPALGDFFLRTDYMPNRIFRFDGTRWLKYEDISGTSLIQGPNNNTLIGSFVNDTSTYATVGNVVTPTRQSLSNALTPKADNIP
jgi:hypothetical protein